MKNTALKNEVTTIDSIQPLRVIKLGTCLTLSAKSNLTYHIGCSPESEVSVRVYANDGGGLFSQEWVSIKAIQEALAKYSTPFTSSAVRPLFIGKSANTPAFLLAVLKHEGLIQPVEGKQRCYEVLPQDAFNAEVNKLISSDVDLKVEEKKVEAAPIIKSPSKASAKKSKDAPATSKEA